MKRLEGMLLALIIWLLPSLAMAQLLGPAPGGSSSLVIGTTPIMGGATTQVLYNLAGVVTSDSSLTYAGSGGPLETALGSAAAPVISNNVSPTTGLYWRVTNGQGIGFTQSGILTFDCGITTTNACTTSNNTNITVSGTGVVNASSLGLGGGGNITWATRTKITANGADGGLLISNNAGTQTFAMSTTATAGQAGFVGGIAATLASATGTNVVCNTPGTTTAITVQVFATGCVASDADIKQNIRPVSRDAAFDIVMAMQPVQYEYRPEQNMGDDEHIGFTAQQIAGISSSIPGYDMITYREDGHPYAVKYNEMAALFAAALQKMQAEIDDLKTRLGGLR